jgi:hypothetical protein
MIWLEAQSFSKVVVAAAPTWAEHILEDGQPAQTPDLGVVLRVVSGRSRRSRLDGVEYGLLFRRLQTSEGRTH